MARPFLSSTRFVVDINRTQLLKDITFKNNRAVTLAIRKELEPKIEKVQDQLVKDFSFHTVTREIESGPKGSNSSGTLSGYGNLFSFIGFESGDRPTEVIKRLLSEKMKFKVSTMASGKFKITIYVPSKQDVFAISPLPWATGSSWAEGIEKGISNLGSFLFKPTGIRGSSKGSRSRSGTGIQSKKRQNSVTFKNTPYISAIFKKFQKNLEKLDK